MNPRGKNVIAFPVPAKRERQSKRCARLIIVWLLLGIAKLAMALADKVLPGRKLVRGIRPDGGENGGAA